jgi:hypothetical protein
MGLLQEEWWSVPGQDIHKVRCLALLECFKKLMWHGNSWTSHGLFGANCFETHRRWNVLSSSFSSRNLWHISFEAVGCLHNIVHERKRRCRMSSAITCVKWELANRPNRLSSPSSVVLCRKCGYHFYGKTLECLIATDMCESISISWALRLLRLKRRTTAPCSNWHVVARNCADNNESHITARRIDRYPWIFYCWIADFLRNTDIG